MAFNLKRIAKLDTFSRFSFIVIVLRLEIVLARLAVKNSFD